MSHTEGKIYHSLGDENLIVKATERVAYGWIDTRAWSPESLAEKPEKPDPRPKVVPYWDWERLKYALQSCCGLEGPMERIR